MKNITAFFLIAFSLLTLTQSQTNIPEDFNFKTLSSQGSKSDSSSLNNFSESDRCMECELLRIDNLVAQEILYSEFSAHKIFPLLNSTMPILDDHSIIARKSVQIFPIDEINGYSMPLFILQQAFLI
ncbi:hypothetical protein [Pedobacter helvus]|uniref:Uncharacterized protein n=1 Tax=Pedobacter helvus TaxID=2563444 RepID=A0ABW9JMA8_9SPHI|nr:hypothetical protein [Pedobacter ureilyticus]